MRAWQEDMLTAIEDDSLDHHGIFVRMEVAVHELGFEYCTYGIRVPFPASNTTSPLGLRSTSRRPRVSP